MRMPLVETMRQWISRGGERWHTPGHKGNGEPFGGLDFPWQWDLTEVGPLVRDGSPADMVRASEEQLARQLAVRRSWYSVQGASLPVMAAMLAAFPPGARVVIERHAHRSALAACILGDLRPLWIPTTVDAGGRVLPSSPAQWESYSAGSDGMVITRPTYDGIALPGDTVKQLTERAHARGQKVVVDEAHGAHWPGRSGFPDSALYLGADLVAHGVHKTEPTLTQTGALHLVGGTVNQETVEWWWNLLATSSPSYLLLASLDRWQAERADPQVTTAWEEVAVFMQRLWSELNEQGFRVWQLEAQRQWTMQADPAKLSIRGPGPMWARQLAKAGHVEKVEPGLLTFIVGPGQSLHSLREAISALDPDAAKRPTPVLEAPELPEVVMNPRDAAMRPVAWVPLSQAMGRIAGRAVVPYPPGSAWVVPGERWSEKLVKEILRSRAIVDRSWEGCQASQGEVWIGVIDE